MKVNKTILLFLIWSTTTLLVIIYYKKQMIKANLDLLKCLTEQQQLLIQNNNWGQELYRCKMWGCKSDLNNSAEEIKEMFK